MYDVCTGNCTDICTNMSTSTCTNTCTDKFADKHRTAEECTSKRPGHEICNCAECPVQVRPLNAVKVSAGKRKICLAHVLKAFLKPHVRTLEVEEQSSAVGLRLSLQLLEVESLCLRVLNMLGMKPAVVVARHIWRQDMQRTAIATVVSSYWWFAAALRLELVDEGGTCPAAVLRLKRPHDILLTATNSWGKVYP